MIYIATLIIILLFYYTDKPKKQNTIKYYDNGKYNTKEVDK